MTPDAEVRALLDEGDAAGAATLAIRRLGPEVLGYLERIVDDRDDARDVFETFAEDLWRWLPSWRGEGSLRTAAYRIAWHAAARFRREAWRRRHERLRTTMASRVAASITSPESRLAAAEPSPLDRLRMSLDPAEQTLLVLRVDRELSWSEVAEVLSADGEPLDAAAVRKRFERTKDKLARLARGAGLLR